MYVAENLGSLIPDGGKKPAVTKVACLVLKAMVTP
jgi:hypothetical protein